MNYHQQYSRDLNNYANHLKGIITYLKIRDFIIRPLRGDGDKGGLEDTINRLEHTMEVCKSLAFLHTLYSYRSNWQSYGEGFTTNNQG